MVYGAISMRDIERLASVARGTVMLMALAYQLGVA